MAGEFDCPVREPKQYGVFRRCEPVANQSSTFCQELSKELIGSIVYIEVGTRYADTDGNTYVLEQVLDDNSGDPAPPSELLPVDIFGVRYGQGFRSVVYGCPEDHYIVRSCTDIYGDGIRIYRLTGGVSSWPDSDIGTLFEVPGGVCYEIFKRVGELEARQYSFYALRKDQKRGEGGCGDCPGGTE